MKLLSRIFGNKTAEGKALRSVFSGGAQTVSNQTVNPDTALRVAAVFACVKVISESIASLPLHTYQRNGKNKEKAVNHPLYGLLHDSPNPRLTSYEFRALMMHNVLMHGNFYAQKLTTKGGQVGELIPMNPKTVQPKWNKEKTDIVYEVSEPGTGRSKQLQAEEIFHIKGLSTDGLVGLSPIAQARESIGLSMAAEGHAAALFGNGARPGGIIYFNNPIGQQAQEQFYSDWIKKFSGGGFGKVALLQATEAKYEQLGISNDDAQFIEIRAFQLSEIARIFRVPPHLIGDLSKATFSNIEQQSLEFVVHCLRPWLVNIEQVIHKSLLSERDRKTHFVEFSVDALLRGDITSRYAAYNTAIQAGFMSRDEIRELENRNPIPDGKGEIFLQPLNMAEVGQEGEPVKEEEKQDPKRELTVETVKRGLKGVAVEAIKRATRKSCEDARRSLSNGVLEEFLVTCKTKHAEFLGKIIRSSALAYASVLREDFPSVDLDSLVAEFCQESFEEFARELNGEVNPGVLINGFESDSGCEYLAEKLFKKIEQGVLC
jgi:HK97 family phage portal protein